MKQIFALLAVLALVACTPVPTSNSTSNITFANSSLGPSQGTATDGSTMADTEMQPVGDFAAKLNFTEGDLIRLQSYAVDPDNDKVTLTFSKPFDNEGTWQTKIGDAGDYPVTVTATDSKGASTTTRVLVTVANANRPPTLDGPDSVTVKEGDTINLNFTTSDPDGDQVVLSFSGWMKSNEYTTNYNDAGNHTVTVTADDGKLVTKKTVLVTVENVNRPPVITVPESAAEGIELKQITLSATATDPDGDKVVLSYGKPFNTDGTWTPELDEAGDYNVTVTASDGTDESTATIPVHIAAANRPPSIVVPTADGVLHFKEGDLIDLRTALNISDPEGEKVVVHYSGWMQQSTYQTTYDDAGRYTVTVTATDASNHTVTSDVVIIVDDVNRPPVFVRPA